MKNFKKSKLFLIVLLLVGIFIGFALMYKTNKPNTNNSNKNEKNVINIAMALDEGYLYPTVVSITSMLENKNKDSVYHYYIMHPENFSEKSKEALNSFGEKYSNCTINLINMEDKYKNARQGHVTTPTYYRLSLSDLLPNEDKVLWLDGDTIIFKDLTEMYNLDMEGYCYKGFLDYSFHYNELETFGIRERNYICAGVMVLNLKELRRNDAVSKFEDFIEKNNEKLSFHDQTTINVVFHDKIGVLPAKYGLFNFNTEESAMDYLKNLQSNEKYSKKELKEAINDPCLFHCALFKPWKGYKNKDNSEYGIRAWWEYAEKTNYFNEIKDKYNT